MWVNVSKIDARIQKLQEIRRIAADPEMLDLLQEFITAERATESEKLDSSDRDERMISTSDSEAHAAKESVEPVMETSSAGGIWGIRRR